MRMTLITQEEYDRLHEKRMREEAQDALERAIAANTALVTESVTAEVQRETTVNNLRSAIESFNLDFDSAADALKIDGELREYCRKEISRKDNQSN